MGDSDAGRVVAFGALIAALWSLMFGGIVDSIGGLPLHLMVWSAVAAIATAFVFLHAGVTGNASASLPFLLPSLFGLELAEPAVWIASEVVLALMVDAQHYPIAFGLVKGGAGAIVVGLSALIGKLTASDPSYRSMGILLDALCVVQLALTIVVLVMDRRQNGRLSAVKAPAYEAFEPHVQQRRVGADADEDDDDERRPLANEGGL